VHFYQKNIGDFNNATRHLTRVERSLFSDAIELYYDTEKPLTSDVNKLNRLLLAHSQDEKDALLTVLAEFFTLTDDGYFNKRCNEEILKYQSYMDSKSKAGKASAEKRAKQKATCVKHVFNTRATKQNQEPLTINQEPEGGDCNSEETTQKTLPAIPTRYGEVAKALVAVGMQTLNASNPTFIALVDAGATPQEFVDAMQEQKSKNGKTDFNYIVAVVKGRRSDAAKLTLHQGAMPNAPPKNQSIHDKRTATAKAMFGDLENGNDNTRPIYDVSDYTTIEPYRPLISSHG